MVSELNQKISGSHLARNAYLYVRQSTLKQVIENTESTKRQYALRDKAMSLGWSSENTIRLVAGLGGFLGRKCDGEPGAQTIWRGLGCLSYLAAMYGDLTGSTEPLGVPQVLVSRKTRYG
jgi:hypothetical protein